MRGNWLAIDLTMASKPHLRPCADVGMRAYPNGNAWSRRARAATTWILVGLLVIAEDIVVGVSELELLGSIAFRNRY